MNRDNTTYPTEIIPASKLKTLPLDEREDFLVVRRTEKGMLVSGLRNYLEKLKRKRLVRRIQKANKEADPKQVMKDVIEAQQAIRSSPPNYKTKRS